MMPAQPAVRLNVGTDPRATATSKVETNVKRDPFYTPRAAVDAVVVAVNAALDDRNYRLALDILRELHDVATD